MKRGRRGLGSRDLKWLGLESAGASRGAMAMQGSDDGGVAQGYGMVQRGEVAARVGGPSMRRSVALLSARSGGEARGRRVRRHRRMHNVAGVAIDRPKLRREGAAW